MIALSVFNLTKYVTRSRTRNICIIPCLVRQPLAVQASTRQECAPEDLDRVINNGWQPRQPCCELSSHWLPYGGHNAFSPSPSWALRRHVGHKRAHKGFSKFRDMHVDVMGNGVFPTRGGWRYWGGLVPRAEMSAVVLQGSRQESLTLLFQLLFDYLTTNYFQNSANFSQVSKPSFI